MNNIRGHADDSLTTEYVWNVGKGLAEWLPEEGDILVIKSEDAHSPSVHALVEGILLQGRNVEDLGTGDQHALVSNIGDKQAAGGVFIRHDGLQNLEIIELYDARGVLITADNGLTEIGELVEAGNFVPAATKGELKML